MVIWNIYCQITQINEKNVNIFILICMYVNWGRIPQFLTKNNFVSILLVPLLVT